MLETRTKLQENGRIVIPATYRKKLQLKSGEDLVIRLEDDELHIYSLKHSLEKAQTLVRQHSKNKSLVSVLKEIRKLDVENE